MEVQAAREMGGEKRHVIFALVNPVTPVKINCVVQMCWKEKQNELRCRVIGSICDRRLSLCYKKKTWRHCHKENNEDTIRTINLCRSRWIGLTEKRDCLLYGTGLNEKLV